MSRRRRTARPGASLVIRRKLLLLAFLASAAVLLGRAFQLQALEHDRWLAAAEDQQRARVPTAARRGTIFDRDGVPLALSHETFRISVAPREVRNRGALARALREELDLPAKDAARATDPGSRWVVLPGRYSARQRQRLGEPAGVYYERRLERFYPQGEVGREVIGSVAGDGRALGGIEQRFDDRLRGTAGYSVMRRVARGAARPALSLPVVPPSDGADVHLTIDFDLQEIADGALRRAIDETGASGGDLLILDPRTGELLAATSRRGGRAHSLAAATEPYEPGSTLKPFLMSALLGLHRVELTDSVDGEGGVWRDPNGRAIRDAHPAGPMTLREAFLVSSNVAMVKLVDRLAPGEQYESLRAFGFGTPTGIEYPSEAAGRLRRPSTWSRLSAASLAMGYEVSVTPLQLAVAYGALANGGVLMEPYLIRRVVARDGTELFRREPRVVRRAVSEAVARELTDVLTSVVEEGTARRAWLSSFAVAGKTGTARRTGPDGRYESGSYTSTFASYFPAHDPQLVILVKLDRPSGAYYGGLTAAPVTKETLQGILAAHTGAVDGRSLLRRSEAAAGGGARERAASPGLPREGTYVFLLGDPAVAAAPAAGPVVVPALAGLSLRDASRRAHSFGLRVSLSGRGAVERSEPAPGAVLQTGDTLRLFGSAP